MSSEGMYTCVINGLSKELQRNIAHLKSKTKQRLGPEARKGYTYSLFLLLTHGW